MVELQWESYIQKPVVIQAVQVTENMTVENLPGIMQIYKGEYIIKLSDDNYQKMGSEQFMVRFSKIPTTKMLEKEN